ncbi:hypothetical protein STIAU_2196, partial [Stigmatella aurantiaca DW4/3-1]
MYAVGHPGPPEPAFRTRYAL